MVIVFSIVSLVMPRNVFFIIKCPVALFPDLSAEQSLKDQLESFTEVVYRCGYAKGECGVTFEMGYIEDKTTEDMFHLTPIEGRYPENSGEICIDKVTLNSLGYAAKVGQKLELTCMDYNQSELKTESFMVVGIIEQRITMSDLGTEYIQRQFSGVVNNEMVTVNAPYAYVYGKEANTIYKNGIQKILLANVAVTDNFDDQDMKNILCDEFIRDGVWTGEFLFNPNKVNNRSWMASDNYNKNEIYHTQLESTKLSGWDYFMDRDTNYTVKGYGSEIRHDTGISQNDLDTIRTCGAVEKSEAMIINLSTKITVESSENNRLTMDTLEKYVVEGRIDLDKIKAGKEVELVVQDIQECSWIGYSYGGKCVLWRTGYFSVEGQENFKISQERDRICISVF